MKQLYLQDISVGQHFSSKSVTLTAAEIIRFAHDNDPQFFHVDESAAADSVFDGLIASGWQTAALAVKLLLDSLDGPFAGGVVGAETRIAWRRPVRPGDRLRIEATVSRIKHPRSAPDRGFVSWVLIMYNQHNEIVHTQDLTAMALRDPARA